MIGSLLFLSLLFAAPAAQSGDLQSPSLREELTTLEEERLEAYVKGDREVLERQFASEYRHINLRGGMTDKDQEIAFYAPGRFSLENGTIDDITVHDYGDVAVLHGKVHWTGAVYQRRPGVEVDLSGDFSVTRVYVKRDGRWQLTASHASQIPAPAAQSAP